MGDSLQNQLRALGLANSQSGQRSGKKQSPDKAKKPAGSSKKQQIPEEVSLHRAYALREREEKRQADRSRQQQLEEQRRRRELNRAIREIVTARRLNIHDAEMARHFMFNGRIRKVYVTMEQRRALAAGELGIVYLSGSYHLLEPDALKAVRQLSAEHVVDLDLATPDEDPGHPVPDDLVW